jgi:hypothetical protein
MHMESAREAAYSDTVPTQRNYQMQERDYVEASEADPHVMLEWSGDPGPSSR